MNIQRGHSWAVLSIPRKCLFLPLRFSSFLWMSVYRCHCVTHRNLPKPIYAEHMLQK